MPDAARGRALLPSAKGGAPGPEAGEPAPHERVGRFQREDRRFRLREGRPVAEIAQDPVRHPGEATFPFFFAACARRRRSPSSFAVFVAFVVVFVASRRRVWGGGERRGVGVGDVRGTKFGGGGGGGGEG